MIVDSGFSPRIDYYKKLEFVCLLLGRRCDHTVSDFTVEVKQPYSLATSPLPCVCCFYGSVEVADNFVILSASS